MGVVVYDVGLFGMDGEKLYQQFAALIKEPV